MVWTEIDKTKKEDVCSNCGKYIYSKIYHSIDHGVHWYHSDNGMYANEKCRNKKQEIDISIDFDFMEELRGL